MSSTPCVAQLVYSQLVFSLPTFILISFVSHKCRIKIITHIYTMILITLISNQINMWYVLAMRIPECPTPCAGRPVFTICPVLRCSPQLRHLHMLDESLSRFLIFCSRYCISVPSALQLCIVLLSVLIVWQLQSGSCMFNWYKNCSCRSKSSSNDTNWF